VYGAGINRMGEVLDMAVAVGFVEKSGAWYAYNGNKIGQGKANSCQFLSENPEIAADLEARVREQLLPKPSTNRDVEETQESEEFVPAE